MFYIYDCNTGEYFCESRSSLYNFVNKEGTVFGNYPLQKRRFIEKVLAYGVWFNSPVDTRLIKYIVYDEFFNLIDYKILEEWSKGTSWRNRNRFKQLAYNRLGTHTFRRGPVPGIHNYGNGHYHRRPKTTNELRANCDAEYKEYVRNGRWVPCAYDDLPISIRRDKKSWKKNKKKRQWM